MIIKSVFKAIIFCHKIGADWTTRFLLLQQSIRRGLAARNHNWYAQIVEEQTMRAFHLRLSDFVQLHLRTQDMPIFFEIFKREDYRLPIQKSYDSQAVVVDLGANIGLASVFFHQNYFPNARFIAVEPSPKNILVLQKNLANVISKAEIVPAVVGDKIGMMLIDDNQVGYNVHIVDKKSVNTEGEEKTEVISLTMSKIMEDLAIERIDLLKMDIEGTEKKVLQAATDWLPKVQAMVIELHGDYHEEQFRRDVEPFGFQVTRANAKHLFFATRF